MNKGKIILSAAALLVTAAGAISFKSAPKHFGGGAQLNGSYKTVGGNTFCVKVTCWKTTGQGTTGQCHTAVSKNLVVRATYTAKTTGGVKCANPLPSTTHKTHVN